MTWKEAMEEKGQSKCRKDEDHDLWYEPDLLQSSDEFHVLSVALEWAGTESSAMAASTGCTRYAVGSSAWQRTLITDVQSVPGNYMPLGQQTT